MSDELGKAELQLGADLAPLDADLKDAETRAALSVAKIQAMFDTLRLKVDAQVSAIDALAARAAAAGVPAGAGGSSNITNVTGGRNEIWGVRGPEHPGSIQNPIAQVLLAGKYFPLGSYAAGVADQNASDVQGAKNDQSGLVTAADIGALTSAIHDLANNASPGSRLAAAGSAGIGESGNGQRVAVALDDDNSQALRDIAATLSRLEQRQAGGGGTILVDHGGGGGSSSGPSRIFVGGPGGGSSQTFSGLRGEQTVRIDDAQYAGLVSAMLGRGGGGGGGGAGTYLMNPEHRSVDVFYHASGEGAAAAAAAPSLLSALGIGTGTLGFAGIGSAASFAGLGFEHFLTTLLGVAGSAAGAAGGAGVLGLGALGAGGVGLGSDLGVSVSAASDTKLLYTDYTNLTAAVDQYGKKSQQAAAAQSQLNFDIKDTLQGTPGVYAELNLAKQLDDLNTKWDQSTSQARVLFAEIADQAVKLANVYMPLVIEAADRNLAIINTDIRPLFTWLEGPDGIQIWRDLENVFAQDMPAGIAAFTQAVELITRVMDLASQDIGGFTAGLDRLFTRLNSESNEQLDQEVQKLVGDFKLWETFVKLLIVDIYDLFHQDVGTGNSIIGTFDTLLEKLHEYETSAHGEAELTNIFMVHKTEILDLIDVFSKLSAIFGHIYLAVAPALVTVMNDAVLPALKAVADVVASLAGKSQLLATILGIALITSKFGGVGAVTSIGGGALGFLTGRGGSAVAGAAASTAEGAGGAAVATGLPGLIESGSLAAGGGLEALGLTGAAGALVGAGGAVSAALPIVIPAVAAAVGAYVLGHDVLGIGKSTPISVGPSGIVSTGAKPFQGLNVGGGSQTTSGFLAGQLPTPNLQGQTLDVESVGRFANYSATQLQALIKEMKEAGGVQLNGINVSKDQLIALAEAALKTKQAFNESFNEAWLAANNFFKNTSRSLPALYDDFNTAMRRIANTVGTNSKEGQKDVATAISQMVEGVQTGLADGTIKAQDGITAIWQVLNGGMKTGAISWKTEWTDMFNTVAGLYLNNKITAQQYATDINGILAKGQATIAATVHQSWQGIFSDLKQQFNHGVITQGQYNAEVHQQTQQMNATAASDFAIFTGEIAAQMIQAGTATKAGMAIIGSEMNAALKALGEPAISFTSVAASPGAGGASLSTLTGLAQAVPGGATGLKVNAPMFIAGEEAPQHPEYVLATNPAYRQRNLGLWASAGHDLGIPGFAGGGVTAPAVHGGGPVYNELVTGALAKVALDAQAFLGLGGGGSGGKGGKGSGGKSGAGFPVNVSGGLAGWLSAGMSLAGVSGGAWLSMLERQAMRESSGNPGSVNNWDINAQHGDPSEGLLQTTLSTFASYMVPGHGNILNPVDNTAAAIRYIIARYGHGNAAAGLAFMLANGGNAYAQGGRIPGFASGGVFGAGGALLDRGGALLGSNFSYPGALVAQDIYAQLVKEIGNMTGANGDVSRLTDLMSFWQGMWALNSTVSGIMSGGPSSAIVTDPTTGAQSIDQADVNTAIAQLSQEVGWESSIIGDLGTALNYSENTLGALGVAIPQTKEYIRGNLTKIAALKKQLGAKGITASRKKAINAQISTLEGQNAKLGGNRTGVGTGGLLGTWAGYVSTLSPIPDQIAGAGASGLGGQLGPAKITLAQLSQELGALSPGALQTALATAQANGQSGGSNQSALVSLLEQQNQILAGQYEVSQAQYAVLSGPQFGLPQFGGSFANGGWVPGPPGAPRTVIAHGGEYIGQPGSTEVHLHGDIERFVDWKIEQNGRQQAQVARRRLPGRAGALLPS